MINGDSYEFMGNEDFYGGFYMFLWLPCGHQTRLAGESSN
jgi:hypothetical protein